MSPPPRPERQEYLVYWKPVEIDKAIEAGPLDHAASDQFRRVNPGDVVWICGRGRRSELVTIGPLAVKKRVGQREAEREIGPKVFKRRFHVIADRRVLQRAREVPLKPLLSRLRFKSKTSPAIHTNAPVGQQLQAIRRLTAEAATLLWRTWSRDSERLPTALESYEKQLEGLGSLDVQRKIATRREQAFLRDRLFEGREQGQCVLCGRTVPVDLLVAAHIKPRSRCTEGQKRDTLNVVPMCLLGCDALFERGYVWVDGSRTRFTAKKAIDERLRRELLRQLGDRKVLVTDAAHRDKYFRWHARRSKRR